MAGRCRFTPAFKARVALEALRGDRTIQEIASRRQVHPNQVSLWKRHAADGLAELFAGGSDRRRATHEAEIHDLHARIGQLVVERDFLSKGDQALSRPERVALLRRDAPSPSLSRQCALLSISRSSAYYQPTGETPETLALMRRIDAPYLQYPFYGSRQMARHLRGDGLAVGRHRMRRLMRRPADHAIQDSEQTVSPGGCKRRFESDPLRRFESDPLGGWSPGPG